MKTLLMVVLASMLASCSSWDMHGGGARGSSGSSGESGASQSDKSRPFTQRTQVPGDIYYGG
ncbi:MAG: hypothetical protein JWQ23_1680 [Herminiimonas sp.]|jgi:hypothetical protein|nr:hypothetical protein [Herminiimonas sp.]